jgi:deoxyribodipyrimidine photolyase-like uncharacterized protein
MEIRQETDYVAHHIQKIASFFGAMRAFAGRLRDLGHRVIYLTFLEQLEDPRRLKAESILDHYPENVKKVVPQKHHFVVDV